MNKKLIRIILVCLLTTVIVGGSIAGIVTVSKENKKEKLVIYNWADYMDLTVLDDFKDFYYEKTGNEIEIVYSMFDTNETMMTEITRGDSQIDLICPSEYAIQKLMNKGLLQKLDMQNEDYEYISNTYPAIIEKVEEVFPADENGVAMTDYFIPYMWGTLGILYNQYVVTEEDLAEGWGLLFNAANNPKLNNKVLMKDSVRDIYAAMVLYLKQEGRLDGTKYEDYSVERLINTVDVDLLKMSEEILNLQRSNGCLKGYEVDFGKDDMINGIAYINLAWSGDALWAIEESWDDNLGDEGDYLLNYFVPEVGGNVWFDGWAIPSTAQNVDAAKEFINFMCRPDIAMRNMMEIGYSSAFDPNKFISDKDEYTIEAINYLVECEYAWEISEEDMAEYEEGEGIFYSVGEGKDKIIYDLTEFFSDERRYPDFSDDEVSATLGVMQDFGDSNEAVVNMWERVKGGEKFPWELIGVFLGIIGAVALTIGIIVLIRELKNRRKAKIN